MFKGWRAEEIVSELCVVGVVASVLLSGFGLFMFKALGMSEGLTVLLCGFVGTCCCGLALSVRN